MDLIQYAKVADFLKPARILDADFVFNDNYVSEEMTPDRPTLLAAQGEWLNRFDRTAQKVEVSHSNRVHIGRETL